MPFYPPDPRFADAVKRVHALSRDLRDFEELKAPSLIDIVNAPFLEDWMLTSRMEPALSGRVTGHPSIADGPVLTSGLFLLDPVAGYARTYSRWYRLGRPLTAVQGS